MGSTPNSSRGHPPGWDPASAEVAPPSSSGYHCASGHCAAPGRWKGVSHTLLPSGARATDRPPRTRREKPGRQTPTGCVINGRDGTTRGMLGIKPLVGRAILTGPSSPRGAFKAYGTDAGGGASDFWAQSPPPANFPNRLASFSVKWVPLKGAHSVRDNSTTFCLRCPSTALPGHLPVLPWTRPPGPSLATTPLNCLTWRSLASLNDRRPSNTILNRCHLLHCL